MRKQWLTLFWGAPKSLHGEGSGTPLQWSCLGNPMDGGAWWAAVHGVAKSQIWLSDFTFTFHFHAVQKEMAPHSSVLAWRIPGKVAPGGLPSMGYHRVGHYWSNLAAAAAAKDTNSDLKIGDYQFHVGLPCARLEVLGSHSVPINMFIFHGNLGKTINSTKI